MLKSNGLHHSKNLPEKFSFSPKPVPTNIAKKLPPQRCSKPLFIPLFNFSHKRSTFAFTHESGYTLGFRRKIAHNGLHAETGRISDWVLSLPSERSARSRTSPGRVSERRTLPLWWLGRGHSRRRRGPAGLRDSVAVSLTALMGFTVLVSRIVGAQKIDRLLFTRIQYFEKTLSYKREISVMPDCDDACCPRICIGFAW